MSDSDSEKKESENENENDNESKGPKEKKITLEHNKYKIPISIPNDYKKVKEIIMKALYLSEEEMERITIYYHDEEGDEANLEEDSYEDAFKSEVWITRKNSQEPQTVAQKGFSQEDKNKIIIETIEKCNKIMNDKISEINKQWLNIIDQVKINFKTQLEKRKDINKTIIGNLMDTLSNKAKELLEEKVNTYNENISGLLKSKIDQSVAELDKEKENAEKNKNDLLQVQNNIKEAVNQSKEKFNEIISMSQANINNDN